VSDFVKFCKVGLWVKRGIALLIIFLSGGLLRVAGAIHGETPEIRFCLLRIRASFIWGEFARFGAERRSGIGEVGFLKRGWGFIFYFLILGGAWAGAGMRSTLKVSVVGKNPGRRFGRYRSRRSAPACFWGLGVMGIRPSLHLLRLQRKWRLVRIKDLRKI
jgi:hypothetical protein